MDVDVEGERVASKLLWLMASYNISSSVVNSLHVDDMMTVRTMAYNVSSSFFLCNMDLHCSPAFPLLPKARHAGKCCTFIELFSPTSSRSQRVMFWPC